MIRPQGHRASGAMLLETLVLMTGLGAGMAVGGAALVLTLKTQHAADLAHRRLVERRALAELFRADVNHATGTLDQTSLEGNQVVACPTCLILRGPGKQQVIYRWASGQLERIAVTGTEVIRQPVPVGPEIGSTELVRGSGKNPLITLKLHQEVLRGHPERSFELEAALGGEWR